jgi:hypothetical protein
MSSSPRTPQDYRDQAEVCERFAQEAISPGTRETMHYLAPRWRALADEDDANAQPLSAHQN